MTRTNTIRSLDTLVQLRSTQVERLQADLAGLEATRARYQANLARMDSLATGSGASGAALALAPALALNCGAYKQDVMALAASHRQDLALHEANMAVSQQRLAQAWTRRELLGKVLEREQEALAGEQARGAARRDDDVATQSWMANRGGLAAA